MIEPLNLQYWLINVLSGDPRIFVLLAFLFIAVVAGIFRMINFGIFLMFIIFIIFMGTFVEMQEFYLLIILLIGLLTAISISKIVKN